MAKKINSNNYNLSGFLAALIAYFIWGVFPFYMGAVSHIDVLEVLAHRIIWALPTTLLIVVFLKRTRDIKKALTTPNIFLMACLTSCLISINWGVYIWAVTHNHALDASLGYFINPLFSTLLGVILLREKLSFLQWIALAIATFAVGLMAFQSGGLPWVSIILPVSFGFYGFFRKALPIGPLQGFTLETIILFIPALFLIAYLYYNGVAHFGLGSIKDTSLLIMAGPLTAIPLILFAVGAKKLSLITTGIMQYIVPSSLFLIAVFWFKTPFSFDQLITFSILWFGLIIYTISTILNLKSNNPKKN